MDGQHLVHAADIQTDAALHGEQMPLQRGAYAKGDDGDTVTRRQPHGIGDIGGGLGKHHGSGRGHVRKGRFVAPMLLAHHESRGTLRPKSRLQRRQKLGRHITGGTRRQVNKGRGVHGKLQSNEWTNSRIRREMGSIIEAGRKGGCHPRCSLGFSAWAQIRRQSSLF